MADKHELLILPNPDDSLIVPSKIRSALAARGLRDATSLTVASTGPLCLARVTLDGKSGLIRKNGKFLVEPKYKKLMNFRCGLASFSYDAGPRCRWGYLDLAGREVVPARFGPASFSYQWDFVDGLALVKINGKFGYIFRDGTLALEPVYEYACRFLGGAAQVKIDGKSRFVDKSGQYVGGSFDFICNSMFYSDADIAEAKNGMKWGFINCRGEFVIEPRFDEIRSISGGGTIAQEGDWACFVNRAGRIIFESRFSDIDPLKISDVKDCDEEGGVIIVEPSPTEKLIVDFNGMEVFRWNPMRTAVSHFFEGVSLVRSFKDGRNVPNWDEETLEMSDLAFFIDKHGKRITGEDSRAIGHFQDGRGIIECNGMQGYIDNTGSHVTEIQYLDACPFMEGYALVLNQNLEWKWIDKTGLYIDEPQFKDSGDLPFIGVLFDGKVWEQGHDAESFRDGLCRFRAEGKYGYVDTRCRTAIPPTFEDARSFANGVAAVKDGQGKWGYIDKEGNQIIPCQFESAGDFEILDKE